jgi:hypothetical protein
MLPVFPPAGPDEPVTAPAPPPTRRQLLARTMRLPRLSGKASAAALIFCFLLTGLLIPAALSLPVWIDFEIVLATWWFIWLIVLTYLLYTGQRVADDHQLGPPRNWFGWAKPAQQSSTTAPSQKNKQERNSSNANAAWWDGFFWGSFALDGEAVAIGCFIVIGLIALAGLVWFLVEIAIPVVLFLLYFVARGMLAHVVNDRHRCKGSVARALLWALVWATVYTAPLLGVVWFIHNIQRT